MKKLIDIICGATLLLAVGLTTEAAPLPTGTRLGLDSGTFTAAQSPCVMGSCIGLEVVPGFMVWNNLTAGTDGGLIIGKNQQPNELVQTVGILGFFSYFNFTTVLQDASSCTTDAAANLFDDVSCQGANCLGKTELGTWHMLWSQSCYPVGSRAGCTSPNCSPEQQAGIFIKDYYIDPIGGRWRLCYDQVVADGSLQGKKLSIILGGLLPGGGAPAAGDVNLNVTTGSSITWKPVVTDPNSDAVKCRLGIPPANGSATVASDCSTGSYTAPAGYVGSESFTYIASDAKFDSNPGIVAAMVAPVPTPLPAGAPIAGDVANPVFYGTGGTWAPRVSDPDNGPGPLTCRIDKFPTLGIAKVNSNCSGGSYSSFMTPFGPSLGGSDSFTYVVNDGMYDSYPGLVTVRWTDAPPPPVYATDVSVSGQSGQLISWKPAVFGGSYPPACFISLAASNGIATVATDCSSGTYQSNPGFIGTDSFKYSASSNIPTGPAYATVTVAVTEPPVNLVCAQQYPVSQFSQTGQGGTISISFSGNIVSHTNKVVKICPGTRLNYSTSSTKGPVVCKVKNNTTRGTGLLKINDPLKCTDRPAGKDKVHFKVKSGVSN